MAADDLTVENFVSKIKAMEKSDRNRITAKKLIELIVSLPEPHQPCVETSLTELRTSIQVINEMASKNATLITSLTTKNDELVKSNAFLTAEVNLLKIHAQECKSHRDSQQPARPAQPTQQPAVDETAIRDEIDKLKAEMNVLKDEINSIQQYLRVNNLEVVELPETNNGESEETLLVNALNQLNSLEFPVQPEDIDISHPLNSQRKDGKTGHVVQFISRKTKMMVQAAKKLETNKLFKFRNKDVYINEHLSKQNRSLFAKAQEKKGNMNYKYCWTRGGTVHMRKTDTSPPITIANESDFEKLT